MKIIHLAGFSTEERLAHRDIIHSNILTYMKTLLQAAHKMDNRLSKKNKVRTSRWTGEHLSGRKANRFESATRNGPALGLFPPFRFLSISYLFATLFGTTFCPNQLAYLVPRPSKALAFSPHLSCRLPLPSFFSNPSLLPFFPSSRKNPKRFAPAMSSLNSRLPLESPFLLSGLTKPSNAPWNALASFKSVTALPSTPLLSFSICFTLAFLAH